MIDAYSMGTAGSVNVNVPAELLTGFAMAKVLWNASFVKYKLNVLGRC